MTTILDRIYWNTITGSVKITYSVSEKVQQDMDGRLKQLIENEAFPTTCEQYQIDKNKMFMPMEVKLVW